jgi:hypothetical protein
MRHLRFHADRDMHGRGFLLKWVQPGLSGLMDGSLSTLAPIFAVVLATHRPIIAFYAGLATALGAGVSMAFSEGLSDTGDLTGRGNPVLRGAFTGLGAFVRGVFHTLPFLIPEYHVAIWAAIVVVRTRRVRPLGQQIGLDQPGHIDIQWHPPLLGALTGHPQPTPADIDVGDVEGQHLAGTQPTQQHQPGHRAIPPRPQAAQQRGGLAPVQSSWQPPWFA